MSAMLEPIFGKSGAVAAQYIITLLVILALVALLYWLIRRYAAGRIVSGSRGRLPRLAIVDALVVDSRRRLVLVRRDNVEHLVLIGGPTDLLVEPSIVRTRVVQKPGQPGPAPQTRQPTAGAATPVPPPPPAAPQSTPSGAPTLIRRARPAGAEEPIPFPPRRSQPIAPAPPGRTPARRPPGRPPALEAPPPMEPARRSVAVESHMFLEEAEEVAGTTLPAAARYAEPARGPRIDPSALFPELTEPEPPEVEATAHETPRHMSEFAPPPARGLPTAGTDDAEAEAVPESDVAMAGDEPVESDDITDPGPQVSDLEKEMARLLGEISSSRSS